MITCGLKLTHDASVALIDDGDLVFSVEIEKLDNRSRYSEIPDLDIVAEILADFGYQPSDVDEWVVDGWDGDRPGTVEVLSHGAPVTLAVGPYRESEQCPDILAPSVTGKFPLGGRFHAYSSHQHVAGHVASAYCSSPFAARVEASFVLVWDGGLFPRLYRADPATGVENLGALFPVIGHVYATAGHHFGPFRRQIQSPNVDDLTVAGKLMAYIALGQPREPVITVLGREFERIFTGSDDQASSYRSRVGGFGSLFEPSMPPLHEFFDAVRAGIAGLGYSDADALASIHEFFAQLLAQRLTERLGELGGGTPQNLCFAGGCALNIKWNSRIRSLACVGEMWVPPFPNDAGSAIGGAALAMARASGLRAVSWHVRSGPRLQPIGDLPTGWSAASCSPSELAALLHESGEPVVVLDGRAELGPRALGGRSILAPAISPTMQDKLNALKGRENYRPIAPICLVEEAPVVFAPGTPDPYMLFDHDVRPEWRERIPAVVHLDGSARLQTVSDTEDAVLAEILRTYRRLSKVPVLCNTSANFNGCGFFPDVLSAIRWGRVDHVWSAGTLYTKTG
ncbi:carbamoyltransferase N-terminal domain-containing protein [Amycolatopsis sp. cmx-11-12]|uniref:carbamoyltransferase N-terminal domain-containing protein n=1 Tax=Amycolatopsis sp. cmx-11-12 TaxID=2785795 RepID=UPI0039181850